MKGEKLVTLGHTKELAPAMGCTVMLDGETRVGLPSLESRKGKACPPVRATR